MTGITFQIIHTCTWQSNKLIPMQSALWVWAWQGNTYIHERLCRFNLQCIYSVPKQKSKTFKRLLSSVGKYNEALVAIGAVFCCYVPIAQHYQLPQVGLITKPQTASSCCPPTGLSLVVQFYRQLVTRLD